MLNTKYNTTIIEIERNMLGRKFILFKKNGRVMKKDNDGKIIAKTPYEKSIILSTSLVSK